MSAPIIAPHSKTRAISLTIAFFTALSMDSSFSRSVMKLLIYRLSYDDEYDRHDGDDGHQVRVSLPPALPQLP